MAPPLSWLYEGQTHVLSSGDQVTMDQKEPERAILDLQQGGGPANAVYGQPAQGNLPPGWVSGVDQASGQTYYYNEQTGQSQWEPPPQQQQGGGFGQPQQSFGR